MGYRSDVCLILTFRGEEQLRAKIASLPDNDETSTKMKALLDDYPDTTWIDHSTGSVLYHWESLKWYNDYTEVKFMDQFFDEIDSDDYLFLRVGEDYLDIRVKGNFWDNPYGADIYRRIDYQLPKPKGQYDYHD